MSLRKLWETVKDREAWRAAVRGVTKNQTWLSNWTTADDICHNLHTGIWGLCPNIPIMPTFLNSCISMKFPEYILITFSHLHQLPWASWRSSRKLYWIRGHVWHFYFQEPIPWPGATEWMRRPTHDFLSCLVFHCPGVSTWNHLPQRFWNQTGWLGGVAQKITSNCYIYHVYDFGGRGDNWKGPSLVFWTTPSNHTDEQKLRTLKKKKVK